MKRRAFLFSLPALAADWPSFRGDGSSISDAKELPREWAPDKNIAWSADVPGKGESAPVLWKDRIFVTSASGGNLLVSAYDTKTGSQVWSRQLASSPGMTVGAFPTPLAEAGRMFALFDSGDVAAFDDSGNVLWQRSLSARYGPWTGKRGVATSLRRTKDAVIVFVSQRDMSFLLAADPETGKTDWKVDRPQPAESWSTPAVLTAWQREIIVLCAGGAVEGYSTQDGKLLWRKDGIPGTLRPSPLPAGENRVLIASSERGSNLLLRINPPGREPDILWRAENIASGHSSPLVYDGVAYFISPPGALFALDVETGKALFTERLPAEQGASPVAWRDRIYFFGLDGTTAVMAAGRKPARIAVNKIPGSDPVHGVAAADDALYFRTPSRLIRVGIPAAPKPKLWTPPKS